MHIKSVQSVIFYLLFTPDVIGFQNGSAYYFSAACRSGSRTKTTCDALTMLSAFERFSPWTPTAPPPPPPVQVHVNPAWTHSFSTSVSEHNNTLAPSQLLMTPITLIYSRLTASARALRTKCWTLSFGPAVVPVLYNMGLQLLKLAPSVSRRPSSWCYWETCSSETIRPVAPYLFLSKTVKDSVQVWCPYPSMSINDSCPTRGFRILLINN